MANTIVLKTIGEAPIDGQQYTRSDGAWQTIIVEEIPSGGSINQVITKNSGTDYDISWQDSQGLSDAPSDGNQYARQDAGWVIVSEGTGITNLSFSRDATTLTVESDTGTNAVLPVAIAATSSGIVTGSDKTIIDDAARKSISNTFTSTNFFNTGIDNTPATFYTHGINGSNIKLDSTGAGVAPEILMQDGTGSEALRLAPGGGTPIAQWVSGGYLLDSNRVSAGEGIDVTHTSTTTVISTDKVTSPVTVTINGVSTPASIQADIDVIPKDLNGEYIVVQVVSSTTFLLATDVTFSGFRNGTIWFTGDEGVGSDPTAYTNTIDFRDGRFAFHNCTSCNLVMAGLNISRSNTGSNLDYTCFDIFGGINNIKIHSVDLQGSTVGNGASYIALNGGNSIGVESVTMLVHTCQSNANSTWVDIAGVAPNTTLLTINIVNITSSVATSSIVNSTVSSVDHSPVVINEINSAGIYTALTGIDIPFLSNTFSIT